MRETHEGSSSTRATRKVVQGWANMRGWSRSATRTKRHMHGDWASAAPLLLQVLARRQEQERGPAVRALPRDLLSLVRRMRQRAAAAAEGPARAAHSQTMCRALRPHRGRAARVAAPPPLSQTAWARSARCRSGNRSRRIWSKRTSGQAQAQMRAMASGGHPGVAGTAGTSRMRLPG